MKIKKYWEDFKLNKQLIALRDGKMISLNKLNIENKSVTPHMNLVQQM